MNCQKEIANVTKNPRKIRRKGKKKSESNQVILIQAVNSFALALEQASIGVGRSAGNFVQDRDAKCKVIQWQHNLPSSYLLNNQPKKRMSNIEDNGEQNNSSVSKVATYATTATISDKKTAAASSIFQNTILLIILSSKSDEDNDTHCLTRKEGTGHDDSFHITANCDESDGICNNQSSVKTNKVVEAEIVVNSVAKSLDNLTPGSDLPEQQISPLSSPGESANKVYPTCKEFDAAIQDLLLFLSSSQKNKDLTREVSISEIKSFTNDIMINEASCTASLVAVVTGNKEAIEQGRLLCHYDTPMSAAELKLLVSMHQEFLAFWLEVFYQEPGRMTCILHGNQGLKGISSTQANIYRNASIKQFLLLSIRISNANLKNQDKCWAVVAKKENVKSYILVRRF
ncbi:hypothetical protein K493DRAFT_295032 [Basidiobolus meristosporus CBS 931.73]|uniref:Uncharacterized protein n=1 Tax=Basidiobolus meristosporus CBS 931.73 TaxID=1314790 RepID=A0A1Y1ZDT4_9FUNG|nr:hypothetical protein K493DRAFT_295032 [Basidiobolus meristosporus CBS 931.73]|eukprot:ORY08443.1 hypothetical protein K493DRAFT_295032 [Basidiobolus meristosporus CBS 931.73]